MDVERCAALHNELFRLGWIGLGNDAAEIGSRCKTWKQYFATEFEEQAIPSVFSDDLIAFLEKARVPEDWNKHNLFYYVRGLVHPSYMMEATDFINEMYSEDERNRYILLYSMNQFGSHPLGLVLVSPVGSPNNVPCPS